MKKKTLAVLGITVIIIVGVTVIGVAIHNKDKDNDSVVQVVHMEETEDIQETVSESDIVESESTDTEVASDIEPTEPTVEIEETTEPTLEMEETTEPVEADTPSSEIIIVEELDTTMYAIKNGNIRNGDSTDYDRVGGLEYLANIHVTGKTSNNWYRIEWGDTEAYVSASLLQAEKPVAQSPTTTTPSTNTNAGNNSGGGSTTPSNNGCVKASQVINSVTGQPYKDGDKTPDGLTYVEMPDWF